MHAAYIDLEHSEAWKDYMAKLARMRAGISNEILLGTLDRFGKDRSDEKRAVLAFLTSLLTIPANLHNLYHELNSKRIEQERKAAERGPLHGPEWANTDPGVPF